MANKQAESPLEESVVQPETVISYQEASLKETVEQPLGETVEDPLGVTVEQPETVTSYQEAPLEETVEQPETVISYEDVVSLKVLLISLKIASKFIKSCYNFIGGK